MIITIEVPEYATETGVQWRWREGFTVAARIDDGAVVIAANREGLISLAGHLLGLAQAGVPAGYHLHLDEYNALEEGSVELIIEKIAES
jgi:hypothetical protein